MGLRMIDVSSANEKLSIPLSGLGLHNPDAEMGVLAVMLKYPEYIPDILDHIKDPQAFLRKEHQIIFEALLERFINGQHIDAIVVAEHLAEKGLLAEAGGLDYLKSLILSENLPSPYRACEEYARIVKKYYLCRTIVGHCLEIIQQATENQEIEPEALVDSLDAMVKEIIKKQKHFNVCEFGEVLEDLIKSIKQGQAFIKKGIETGFSELDELLCGFQPGQLIVIAGRPSMGKTSLALSLIRKIALVDGKPTLFFTFEMPLRDVVQTILCAHASINTMSFKKELEVSEVECILEAQKDFTYNTLYICDDAGMNILSLRTTAKKFFHEKELDLIVIDYLQMISPIKPGASRQEDIASISRSLKSLAVELNIPVVALAQLNRQPEGREDHRPRLADLRESGVIEQDADVVLLLYRDEYYNRPSAEQGLCEVIVAKNRTGPTGVAKLHFQKEFMRFQNRSSDSIMI